MSILGTRVVRVEDPGFLTRGGVYTEDIVDEALTGAVYATFVRSPIAHARVVSILNEAYRLNTLRLSSQDRAHGVHSVNGLGALHDSSSLSSAPSPDSGASARSMSPSMGFSTRVLAPISRASVSASRELTRVSKKM